MSDAGFESLPWPHKHNNRKENMPKAQHRRGAMVRRHRKTDDGDIVYTDGELYVVMRENRIINWEYHPPGKQYHMRSNKGYKTGLDALVDAQKQLGLEGLYWFAKRLGQEGPTDEEAQS